MYEIFNATDWSPAYILKDLGDGMFASIPFDEANADYQQYLIDTNGGLPLPKETK